MKVRSFFSGLLFGILFFPFNSCKKDKTADDPLGGDPTKEVLDQAITASISDMRIALENYLDVTAIIGREVHRFSPGEQRYTTDLLGSGNAVLDKNAFYFTAPWQARYDVIKQAVSLMKAAGRSSHITDAERKGYTGVAKTIIAYELLMNLNLTYTNGIYINLASDNPASGTVIPYPAAMDSIARLLNEAKTALTGSVTLSPLPTGFSGFADAQGFLKFNRALAARVALYREQWTTVLTALNESFFNLNGALATGPQHTFATFQGDILNPFFIAQNQDENVRLAHPSYAVNITPGDDRISKTTLRTSAKSQDGLSSNRDVWVYTTNVAGIPFIRNEELILMYAEAKIRTNALPDGIVAINRIRTSHNMSPYAGSIVQAALLNEILVQRRYSLFLEGHRWVDMRRYGRLNQLPLDRQGDEVWEKFPLT